MAKLQFRHFHPESKESWISFEPRPEEVELDSIIPGLCALLELFCIEADGDEIT